MKFALNDKDRTLIRKSLSRVLKNKNIDLMKKNIQHGNTSTYKHCLRVVIISYLIVKFLKINLNMKNLLMGAFLHDYFLYDWHYKGDKLHGLNHPHIAVKNAKRDFNINDEATQIIETHMFPLTITKPPKNFSAMIVCIADKIAAINEINLKKLFLPSNNLKNN